jgi:superfamily I DNA and/or RNA helicase
VDRFQGQESPIVFVSMVRHPQRKLSARANTAQYERINVAFSRAQELLVIVGSAKTFLEYPVELPNLNKPGKTKVDVYKQIIDEIRLKGSFRVANEVIRSNEWQQLHPQSARQSTGQSFQPQSKSYFSLHPNLQQTYSK